MFQKDKSKPSLLLHCCCSPCASYVLECLVQDYKTTLLFYNPNIEPREEYDKRRDEIYRLLEIIALDKRVGNSLPTFEVKLLECEYDNTVFESAVLSLRNEPEGGKRCRVCFELRLEETARRARAGEYDIFATTLSVGPHKDAELINEIGRKISDELGVEYLSSNFKTNDGFKRSVELSKKYGLYRQRYCGCIGG